MGSAAVKIRAIAGTALQETLRRRVLWIVLILVAVIALFMGSGMAILSMATESGEADTADALRANLVGGAIGLWTLAAQFLALFLGAVALSSEATGKTLVNVLSRPIGRPAYLTGRWLGILAFLWAFQLAGILLSLGVARLIDASYAPTLWVGLAGTLINVTLLSGVSLGLSVVVPPVVAGVGAFLLPVLPALVERATANPWWLVKWPATAIYYLMPAKMPSDLVSDSFSKELLNPNYGLYARVLGENALYAVAVFALGCVLFSRRELKLR